MVEVRNINGSSHVLSLLSPPHVHITYLSFSFIRPLTTLHFSLIVSLSLYVFVFLTCYTRASQSGLAAKAVALAQSTNGVMQRGWPRGERGGRTQPSRLPTSGKLNQAKRCLTRWGYTRPCHLLQPLPPPSRFTPWHRPISRFPFRFENLYLQPSPPPTDTNGSNSANISRHHAGAWPVLAHSLRAPSTSTLLFVQHLLY